jgi:predicted nucleic acid-binding Zn ribbon protein
MCGKDFTPVHSKQQTCSQECRDKRDVIFFAKKSAIMNKFACLGSRYDDELE